MRCEELQRMFVQYHLGELENPNVQAIENHLASGCKACNAEMEALLDGIDLFYHVAPESYVSQSMEIRIATVMEAELSKPTAMQPVSSVAASPSAIVRYVSMLASLAAGLLLMMYLVPLKSIAPPQGRHPQVLSGTQVPTERANALEGIHQVPADLHIAQAQFRRTQFVSLRAPATSAGFHGSVVWDPLCKEIHFFGYNFATPPADHEYVLWIDGPDGKPYPAKTLVLDATGNSAAIFRVQGLFSPTAFLTLEPSIEAVEQDNQAVEEL